jgi:hypothetical protein
MVNGNPRPIIQGVRHNGDGTSVITVIGADWKPKQITVMTVVVADVQILELIEAIADPSHPLRIDRKQSAKDVKGS